MTYPDAGCSQLRVVNDYLTYLFHLDNLSDDMDNTGTLSTADEVLNSLYHPRTWNSSARVGKMTREYVHFFLASWHTLTDVSRPEVTISGSSVPRRLERSSGLLRRSISSSKA